MRPEGGLAEVTLGVESDLGSCSVAPCVGLDLYLYDQKSNKSANKKKALGSGGYTILETRELSTRESAAVEQGVFCTCARVLLLRWS